MPDPHLLAAFTATTLVAMLVPGPDLLFVLAAGIRGGPRAGLLATAGLATSEAVHVLLAAAGLTVLLAAAPEVFGLLRLAGAGYLTYLGIRTIRQRTAGTGPVADGRRIYLSGVLTNLTNPKMIVFSVAFLPQFTDPARGPVAGQFAMLGMILIGLEFLVDGAVGVFAGRLGGWLRRRPALGRRLEAATGGLMIALGVRLAVAGTAAVWP